MTITASFVKTSLVHGWGRGDSEQGKKHSRVCVCICACQPRLPLPFDSCMQMKPHKQVHRGKGQHSFPLREKWHSEDAGFIFLENTLLWCVWEWTWHLCLFDFNRYAVSIPVCVCWYRVLLLSISCTVLNDAKWLPRKHLPLQRPPTNTHTLTKSVRRGLIPYLVSG